MKKMTGEQRRAFLLNHLQTSTQALTGSDLAKLTNVSRQVIVNDMNLLKAKNEPIISTSQGYLFLQSHTSNTKFERKIVSFHTPEQTKEELFTIVDCGATVQTVIVEHPVYGEITANLHISSRIEAELFIQQLQQTDATLLSSLTDGTHLHVISAPSNDILDLVELKLREKGFILID